MRILLPSLAGLLLCGCAYVGDPLPPALKVPSPVLDLDARQIGGEIEVTFTIPDKTMEGLDQQHVGAVDLRIGAAAAPFNADQWSSAARSIPNDTKAPGKATARFAARDWANQEVVVGVRLASARNRLSPWSNFVTLRVVPPMARPASVVAAATAAGVALEWANPDPSPTRQWKVFRQSASEEQSTEMATVKEPRFVDIGAAYDVTHKYTLMAIDGTATSELSAPVTITPIDTFPPTAPQGLSALAGPAAAQLSWERNQEPDLALYRVYRAEPNGAFARIAESTSAANYRDTAVTAGRTYRYAVSAVDRKGNEGPKSEPVEILIP